MSDQCYVVDLYVNGERVAYFSPHGYSLKKRLEHIKDWAKADGISEYKIVIKDIDYWEILEYAPASDKFVWRRKVYLVQINTLEEIEVRFVDGRIA